MVIFRRGSGFVQNYWEGRIIARSVLIREATGCNRSDALWLQAVNVVEGGTLKTYGQLLGGANWICTARLVCRGGDGSVRATAGIPSARRDWAYDGHANGALRGDGLG